MLGGGVGLVGLGGIFAVLVGGAVGVGGCCGGCCCCCSLRLTVQRLTRYPSPVPVFNTIKLSVLKRLKVFKHTYKGNKTPTIFKANK